MSDYRAPLKDMTFAVRYLSDMARVQSVSGFEAVDADLVETVFDEAAKFAQSELAPLYEMADREGTRVVDGQVTVPAQIRAAYEQFVASGWGGLPFDPAYDGQGLPHIVATPVMEMWKTANMAFSLCPMLTHAAVEAIHVHGSDRLRDTYLRKLVSGEWTGTMNLTEPQAGSDLAAIKTKAVAAGDHYRLSGRKIFITWGDHDMTDNVVHLVLARIDGAPDGVRGLSLFLVPKYLVNEDGTLGQRNDLVTVSVEHKLGIHGSPTCVLSFGDAEGAVGYLVGEENKGLACMFTMMNHARLAVGVEGLAMGELAYQKSLAYAKDRVQGFVPGEGRVAIIRHPDVRRMLMTMKAYTEAMRALAYNASAALDLCHHPDESQRAAAQARIDLLTPVVKGWSTEVGQELASLAIQVHGGMGYVEETGVAQVYRDARITTIYEGTTGIQANDLIGRKFLRDGGEAMSAVLAEIRALDPALEQRGEACAAIRAALAKGAAQLDGVGQWLLERGQEDADSVAAGAVSFLLLAGTVFGGWQLARAALAAADRLDGGDPDRSFLEAKIATAAFYADQIMPRAEGYAAAVKAGAGSTMALADDQF